MPTKKRHETSDLVPGQRVVWAYRLHTSEGTEYIPATVQDILPASVIILVPLADGSQGERQVMQSELWVAALSALPTIDLPGAATFARWMQEEIVHEKARDGIPDTSAPFEKLDGATQMRVVRVAANLLVRLRSEAHHD